MRSNERGAIAVLMAIVLTILIIPLAAVSLSTFIREATIGELQRSADAGALAGARLVPVGDLPVLPPPSAALAEACEVAQRALDTDDALGEEYSGPASCNAEYVVDNTVIDTLGTCATNALSAPESQIPSSLTSLPGWSIVEARYGQIVGMVERRIDQLTGMIAHALPSITKPGVRVTLTRGVGDGGNQEIPLENAAEADPPTTETKTATARRRVKNVALFPVVVDPDTGEWTVDPNEEVPSAQQAIDNLEALEALVGSDPILGDMYSDLGCTGLFDALAEDLRDFYNPGAGNAPTQGEILSEAQDQGAAVLGYAYEASPEIPDLPDDPEPLPSPSPTGLPVGLPTPAPTPTIVEPPTDDILDALLNTLRIPFLDFVPVCIESTSPLTVNQSACQGAEGALRATLVPNP